MPIYDLAIIGAGWAGFNAALKAKQLGKKVCLIDALALGGTCLNYGCIPTKTLIASAKFFSAAKKSSNFGIDLDHLRLNLSSIMARKDKIIRQLSLGMQSRLAGIDFINASAQITATGQIKVAEGLISAEYILIATGSRPLELADLKFDHKKIISSNDILSLTEIPESLLIVGAGVIGCEFASLFSIFGTKVTLVEKLPQILPGQDCEVARKLEVIFKKKSITVITGADISNFDLKQYAKVLVCIGRQGMVQGLGLDQAGVELKNNQVVVDDYLKSSRDNIYAAGDCTTGVMLAHFAAYQGIRAVENMFSAQKQKADNALVPACIFTEPQIASVGLTEESAVALGLKIKVYKLDFRANAMAQIIEEVDGFIRLICNQANDQIVGAALIGPQATELISSLGVAISAKMTVAQLRGVIFAHPTFSEILHDALDER